ncbi:MAG: mechanosensitive ion channel family protein [Lachnospiraceae bacterium]|nr:mechanosensitive ion channel family protein [Lachnospiraceae bacterium]
MKRVSDVKQVYHSLEDWIEDAGILGSVVRFLLLAAATFVVTVIILNVGKRFFRKFLKSRDRIQVRFVEKLLRAMVIILAVFSVIMGSTATASFGKMLFQGTAILGAIIGLAAQPVISDLICGLMLSTSKPFEIGDRLELDNGVCGVVRDITVRHVVIRTIDTVDVIIPNSKLNAMSITNMSRAVGLRSIHFRFQIAYGSDVKKALEVVRAAVLSSPYVVEGPIKREKEGGPVYFTQFAESSLTLEMTAYFPPDHPSEVVRSDVNLRVAEALAANGIEVPYPHVSVVMKNQGEQA